MDMDLEQKRVRKEITQCQGCWKTALQGGILFKCAGCKNSYYCSKQCQKVAWPRHRERCKMHQAFTAVISPARKIQHDALSAYRSKHAPTLMMHGLLGLGLYSDVTRSQREVFQVLVRPSPKASSSRPGRAFIAIDAKPVPVDELGPLAEGLRRQLKRLADEAKAEGNIGGMVVMTTDIESEISIPWPIHFNKELPPLPPNGNVNVWKESLMKQLNEGIVL